MYAGACSYASTNVSFILEYYYPSYFISILSIYLSVALMLRYLWCIQWLMATQKPIVSNKLSTNYRKRKKRKRKRKIFDESKCNNRNALSLRLMLYSVTFCVRACVCVLELVVTFGGELLFLISSNLNFYGKTFPVPFFLFLFPCITYFFSLLLIFWLLLFWK